MKSTDYDYRDSYEPTYRKRFAAMGRLHRPLWLGDGSATGMDNATFFHYNEMMAKEYQREGLLVDRFGWRASEQEHSYFANLSPGDFENALYDRGLTALECRECSEVEVYEMLVGDDPLMVAHFCKRCSFQRLRDKERREKARIEAEKLRARKKAFAEKFNHRKPRAIQLD